MASNELKLRVLMDFVDKVTKPLKNMLKGNNDLAKALKDTRSQLSELGKKQKDVAEFRELRAGLAKTTTELKAARDRANALARGLHAAGPPTKAMIKDFEKAKQAAAKLKEAHQQQAQQVQELRTRLHSAGIETRNLSQHERTLRESIRSTTAAMQQQQTQLERLAQRERQLGEARKKMGALQNVASNTAVAGYAAKSTGMNIITDLKGTVDESKKLEGSTNRIQALGLKPHDTQHAINFAKSMKSYGTSVTDNTQLMLDAVTIFADGHHAEMAAPIMAKMKFANEALFGAEKGHENEQKFMNMLKVVELRGGAANAETFKAEANMIQKVLTATGGRVGGDQWMDFIKRGGVAAKQLSTNTFFNQMEPLIQEMGGDAVGTGLMSAYQNVYQGKTTVRAARAMTNLGLLDKDKVKYNKIGMVKEFLPGALQGGDLFKSSPLEWIEKVMLPKLAAKGITDKTQILDTIGTIFTNRTASNLIATMYLQREQIHKNEKLNQGAEGIDQVFERGKKMTSGHEIEALARMRDLKLDIGERVMPIYNMAIDAGLRAMASFSQFMKEHNSATEIIIVTLAVVAGLLVVFGTLAIAVAAVLGPFAMLKFFMTTLGIQGGLFAGILGKIAGALRLVGTAVMFIGRALLMNPIGLAITAIAVAAFLIYQYWEPISAFFGGLWQKVTTAFDGGIGGITKLLVNWSPLGLLYSAFSAGMGLLGIQLPADLTTLGGNLMDALANAIGGGIDKVKAAVNGGLFGIGALLLNWSPIGLLYSAFRSVLGMLGIQLPAEFSTFGNNIIMGLANGITSGLGTVKDAIVNVASSTVGWFKEKLGIRSPSRVFAELGGFISEGAAGGIGREQGKVAKAAAALAMLASSSFAPPALAQAYQLNASITAPAFAKATPIDMRGPLLASTAPGAATGTASASPSIYNITINAAPGMDAETIARAVSLELDRRERTKQSRIGSRLTD